MEITILGVGCAKCLRLETIVLQTLVELNAEATVEKVTDERVINRRLAGIAPPGLMINGQLFWAGGEVPPKEKILEWIGSGLGTSTPCRPAPREPGHK